MVHDHLHIGSKKIKKKVKSFLIITVGVKRFDLPWVFLYFNVLNDRKNCKFNDKDATLAISCWK